MPREGCAVGLWDFLICCAAQLWGTVTFSEEGRVNKFPTFEKRSTLNGKNCSLMGANSFHLEKTPFKK